MDGTFIISDGSKNSFIDKVVPQLGLTVIIAHDLRKDEMIGEFVKQIFAGSAIKKLIIPVSLGQPGNNHIGLKIGLYIRFSDKSGVDPMIPIVFLSNRSLETLLLEQADRFALLAVTPGCVLVNEDAEALSMETAALKPPPFKALIPQILDKLLIDRPETTGPHSLANEWGALRLDAITKVNALTAADLAFQRKETLYFQYQAARNRAISLAGHPGSGSLTAPQVIRAVGKKVLYIDDEGYKGWVSILKKLLPNSFFTEITGQGLSEDAFFAAIRAQIRQDWDLILLDLRLLPLIEDVQGRVLPIGIYSGTIILQEIKTINPGTQVIIFTASNKAWNLKELIELGADGYFVKESPEYLIPDTLSLYHYDIFKAQAEECFRKNYLRKMYNDHQMAIAKNTFPNPDFLSYSEAGLHRSFEFVQKGLWEAAYLNYFQIIEKYAEVCFEPTQLSTTDPTGEVRGGNNKHTRSIKRDSSDLVNGPFFEKKRSPENITFHTTLPKLSFIMAFKFNRSDAELKRLGAVVFKRNKVAHPGPVTVTIQELFEFIDLIDFFRANV
ncbi:hypothetical protein IDJ75_11465 [Mucilaginibacter rigui]|uniref:Inactive Receiver domain-containing protein n=1 Tax=Mucilaginibacter rigui TaxID=534635 RepID=A0ABR7X5R9_9SPHI|nr:hypothetical protein [Mucilaginibacter rigui]MBD1385900.1 hypothetical protein [Mucilaginibacter rigui]